MASCCWKRVRKKRSSRLFCCISHSNDASDVYSDVTPEDASSGLLSAATPERKNGNVTKNPTATRSVVIADTCTAKAPKVRTIGSVDSQQANDAREDTVVPLLQCESYEAKITDASGASGDTQSLVNGAETHSEADELPAPVPSDVATAETQTAVDGHSRTPVINVKTNGHFKVCNDGARKGNKQKNGKTSKIKDKEKTEYVVRPCGGQRALIMYNSERLCFKEDLEREPDQVFAKFMRAHKCYDLIPNSSKLVVFDTQLSVNKAFFALLYNGVRAAPLWDSQRHGFTGMLTISDFIYILEKHYKSANIEIEQLEHQKICAWKDESSGPRFIYTQPDHSLLEAVRLLLRYHVHRLPVLDAVTGNPLCVLTHKRLLKFMFLYMNDLPQPAYMFQSLRELDVGTFDDIATARRDTPVIEALRVFVARRISALPIVDDEGRVVDLYAKFDVINLAANKSYNNLDIAIAEALPDRSEHEVLTGSADESLSVILRRLAEREVHRLVLVDEQRRVTGVVSLSDLLRFLVLRHALPDSTEQSVEVTITEPSAEVTSSVDEVGVTALSLEQPELLQVSG